MQIKLYVRVYLGENGAEFPLTLEQRNLLNLQAEKIMSGKKAIRPTGVKRHLWTDEMIQAVQRLTTMKGEFGKQGRKMVAKQFGITEDAVTAKWYGLRTASKG